MFPASWKWNSSAILAMAVVLKSSSISDSEAKIEYSGSHTASWGPPSGLQYARLSLLPKVGIARICAKWVL